MGAPMCFPRRLVPCDEGKVPRRSHCKLTSSFFSFFVSAKIESATAREISRHAPLPFVKREGAAAVTGNVVTSFYVSRTL